MELPRIIFFSPPAAYNHEANVGTTLDDLRQREDDAMKALARRQMADRHGQPFLFRKPQLLAGGAQIAQWKSRRIYTIGDRRDAMLFDSTLPCALRQTLGHSHYA